MPVDNLAFDKGNTVNQMNKRGSGILLHITSLPGNSGIGDLGEAAYQFIDFLAAAGQQYWQFLPVCPTSSACGHSPYMSPSAFAGNQLLIDLDTLVNSGLLVHEDFPGQTGFSEYLVDYELVSSHKNRLLAIACDRFIQATDSSGYETFCYRHRSWLDDYALFMSLREEQGEQPWYQWPAKLAGRDQQELATARLRLADRLIFHKFVQYIFFKQWRKLHDYATAKGIGLIGDIPIYVALDSVDVWANQSLFKVDRKTRLPSCVAGVPPDYFSETGQRWGNPIYRWHLGDGNLNDQLVFWWQQRFHHIIQAMDIVRVDHFRGFESYWEIPATEETAIKGRWVKGPSALFFDAIMKSTGPLPIIAEDLGIITPAVETLRDSQGFPGMRILQFAFESDPTNPYLPHNYSTPNTVVYTGTHDNNTTLGWFLSDKITEATRAKIRRYTNCNDDNLIPWQFVRLALASIANTAILPLQDVLGFGGDCRMNTPSTSQGNWRWRCAPRFLTPELAARLKDEIVFYNRLPPKKESLP